MKNKFSFRKLALVASLIMGAVCPVHADNTSTSTSTSTLQFNNVDGTITDKATGLMWKRCYEGQIWNGGFCMQLPTKYNFSEANALTGKISFAGKNDWRVPSIRELLSLKLHTTSAGDIAPHNSSIYFSSDIYVWSSTLTARESSTVGWVLNNTDRTDVMTIINYMRNSFLLINGVNLEGSHIYALMVRTETPSTQLDIARKTSDYVDSGNGTVIHVPTGLMWQRCLFGQTWNGTTCTGTARGVQENIAISGNVSEYSGKVAGKTDWRVPTEEELFSVVDFSVSKPSINSTIFPNDPGLGIWTNKGTRIYFYDGMIEYPSIGSIAAYGLRFVRTAQPSDYPVATSTTASTTTTPTATTTAPVATTKTDTECLLDWVEARVPTLLTPAHQPTQTVGTISYRSYPTTGVHVGVDGKSLLAVGGSLGSEVVTVGTISNYLTMARAASCQ